MTKYARKRLHKINIPYLNSLKVIFLPLYKLVKIKNTSEAKTKTNAIKKRADTKRKYTHASLFKGPKKVLYKWYILYNIFSFYKNLIILCIILK